MLGEFVADVCEVLRIDEPEVSYDTSHFASDTITAQCNPNGTVIYLRRNNKPTLEQFYAIAHELRHVWQMRTDEERYLSSYLPANLCASLEAYNLQDAEVDAHAFAGLVIAFFFHVRPIFDSFSDSVREKIEERMDALAKELAF